MPKVIHWLAIGLVVFSIAVFILNPMPARSEPTGLESMPGGPPKPLMADPRDFFFRVVPSPARPSLLTQFSTFSINYLPPGSSDHFGDSCTTWPTGAQDAFDYAASQWATYLHSSVPITINACWATNLAYPNLGHGGARTISKDFSGAPLPGTWYPDALANALCHCDLDPGVADIEIAFSSTSSWYFGTDGNPGSGQFDFVSVVMHEIAHGLGFSGTMNVDNNGYGCWGQLGNYSYSYDHFIGNGSGQALIDTGLFPNPSTALGSQLTSNNLYFDGPFARAANGGSKPRLYVPGTWAAGASYCHLDEIYNGTVNALMTWSINSGEAIHVPGPITLAILQDLGWPVSSSGEEVYVSPYGCGGQMPCCSSVQGGIDSEGAVLTVNISQDAYGEDLILDEPKILTLRGGWDATFDNQTSTTTIHGSLTVTYGTAIVENIVLR